MAWSRLNIILLQKRTPIIQPLWPSEGYFTITIHIIDHMTKQEYDPSATSSNTFHLMLHQLVCTFTALHLKMVQDFLLSLVYCCNKIAVHIIVCVYIYIISRDPSITINGKWEIDASFKSASILNHHVRRVD